MNVRPSKGRSLPVIFAHLSLLLQLVVTQLSGWHRKSFQEVKEIKAKHRERIMGNPNVVGFGIGAIETEGNQQWALKVFLGKELLPEQMKSLETGIDGVPISYEVRGVIKALRSKPQEKPKP